MGRTKRIDLPMNSDALIRKEYAEAAARGEVEVLPPDIMQMLIDNPPELERGHRGGPDYGSYEDGGGLSLSVSGGGCFYRQMFWWNVDIEGYCEVGDGEEFSLSQARDVVKSIPALEHIRSFSDGDGEREYAEWLEMRHSTQHQQGTWQDAPAVDGVSKMQPPPWAKVAREDLEASSAMFAVEFASRLYPRLVGSVSYDAQLAAIRQAFIETVEAP